ncbi:MAG: GNAT family N-acetyltransferase [Oscillospiraceae bacterium]|nr:GNAT family N-acetyltransferase [Oscillospiraceae bacterium]
MNIEYAIQMYTSPHYNVFKDMLRPCFNKDYKIPLTEQQLNELCEEIVQLTEKQIAFLDLLFLDGVAKGFVLYQVDTPKSDWCEKETWGCIREFYIDSDIRGKGFGKILALHTEDKLRELSVPHIYLTADYAVGFWIKIGYSDSGEICKRNDGRILVK